jgi:hypothetical protein
MALEDTLYLNRAHGEGHLRQTADLRQLLRSAPPQLPALLQARADGGLTAPPGASAPVACPVGSMSDGCWSGSDSSATFPASPGTGTPTVSPLT